MSDTTKRWLAVAIIAVWGAVGVWLATTMLWSWYSDDALISLRYAERLVQGKGLTWTDGEAVEGYSNLLWVLLCAAASLVFEPMLAARVLGLGALVGCIAAVSIGRDNRLDPWRALGAGGFVALSLGLLAWAVGGLSQTAMGFLGLVSLLAIRRRWVGGAGVLLAALTLMRADGFVYAIALLLGAVVAGMPWRTSARMGLGVVAAWSGQLVFRLLYYGDWVPNTARVKVSFTLERSWVGLQWVADVWMNHAALWIPALAASWLIGRRSMDVWVTVGLWSAYLAYVGGDFFVGWRLFVPVLPLWILLVAELCEIDRRAVGPALASALLFGGWNLTRTRALPNLPDPPHWVFRTKPLADDLVATFGDAQPKLAVDAAGALPFYTGFPAVDMLGLTDAWLPRHPPSDFGKSRIGHDLGNGTYIFDHRPDLIACNSGVGGKPQYRSCVELSRRRSWAWEYQEVYWKSFMDDGTPVHATYYARLIDGPLSSSRTPRQWRYPAHLLGRPIAPAQVLDGRWGVPLNDREQVWIDVPLAAGRWRVQVDSEGAVEAPAEITMKDGRARFLIKAKQKRAILRALAFHKLQ